MGEILNIRGFILISICADSATPCEARSSSRRYAPPEGWRGLY